MITVKTNKSGDHIVDLDQGDLVEADQILATMATPGWKRLEQYWIVARENLIANVKSCVKEPAKVNLAATACASLKGFDECFAIPTRIITRAQEFINAQKEAEHDEQPYQLNDGE